MQSNSVASSNALIELIDAYLINQADPRFHLSVWIQCFQRSESWYWNRNIIDSLSDTQRWGFQYLDETFIIFEVIFCKWHLHIKPGRELPWMKIKYQSVIEIEPKAVSDVGCVANVANFPSLPKLCETCRSLLRSRTNIAWSQVLNQFNPKKCIACLFAYSTTRLLNSLSYPTRLELEKHDSPVPAHGHHLVAKFSKMCHFWHFLRVSRTWPKSTDLLWKI